MRLIFFILIIIIFSVTCTNQSLDFRTEVKGEYLGQTPPKDKSQLFAPGIISKGFDERMIFFAPDGNECFFQLRGVPRSVILNIKNTGNGWTEPKVAFFSGKYFEEFGLSQDGNTIVFTSNRTLNNQGKPLNDFYLWKTTKKNDKWTEPEFLGENFKGAGYPTISNNGNIYFFDSKNDGYGKSDIYVSYLVNGEYQSPVNLGDSINTENYDVDPFIAPDESYIIYASHREKGGLYISYKRNDKSWSKSIYMGDEIGKGESICPSVSPDGKYLFFTSRRNVYENYAAKITYSKKLKILNSPGNGNNDIYWIDAKVINALKPEYISNYKQ